MRSSSACGVVRNLGAAGVVAATLAGAAVPSQDAAAEIVNINMQGRVPASTPAFTANGMVIGPGSTIDVAMSFDTAAASLFYLSTSGTPPQTTGGWDVPSALWSLVVNTSGGQTFSRSSFETIRITMDSGDVAPQLADYIDINASAGLNPGFRFFQSSGANTVTNSQVATFSAATLTDYLVNPPPDIPPFGLRRALKLDDATGGGNGLNSQLFFIDSVQVTSVPTPAALALGTLAGAVALARRRRPSVEIAA